jgi:hypothetical protein
MMARTTGVLKGGPDLEHSAKSGAPTMTDPQRTMPKSIPVVNNAETAANGPAPSGTTDVSATPVSGSGSALDTKPDARTPEGAAAAATPAATTPATPAATPAAPASTAPLPTNRDKDLAKMRELQAKKQKKLDKKKKKDTAAPAAITPDPSATPGAATTPAATTPATPLAPKP